MKYRNGVVHARNAWSDKYKFWENKCIPYINWYKKNRLKSIQKSKHRIPDEYDKRDVQSHLMQCYTDLYMQLRIGRVKKSVIRKMFNYWYKVPGAYLNTNDFVDYDILTTYSMYNGNRNDTHFPNGDPGCYILYITFFKRNMKALTRKQQKILNTLHSLREDINN